MSCPIGKQAHNFEGIAVVDQEFKKICLSDYLGKYVVLFFWQRDFTDYCPTEVAAYDERAKEFAAINTQLIGCSTDSRYSHLAWIQQPRKSGGLGDVHIPILADPTHRITRAFGILNDDEGASYGATFIIDTKGVIRQVTINDQQVGRNVDEAMRLVQAFQYVDTHGEVCPANWRPGKGGIKVSAPKKIEKKQA